ncbi:MAG TPA: DUF4136 domain-containing protein [Cytophagales bacterium]|nr:DUF4136 domain-containing protein [Cytophagales bacterium]
MKRISYVLILFVLLSSCGRGFVANSDFDRSVNLRNYQTFKISEEYPNRPDIDPILNNEFNRKRIANAITAQLKGRNYVESNQNPDLLVKFYVRVKDKQQTQYNNNWGFYYPRTNSYTKSYEESTLIVELVDAAENKLVWQGWAIGEKEYNSKNIEQKTWNKVSYIFRTFPVKPKEPISNDPISYNK